MKLNEGHFSTGTAIIHFLDKAYPEINLKSDLNRLKSDLNMYYFVNKEWHRQICTCPCDFISIYLFALTFAIKLKSANYKSHSNNLLSYDQ